MKKINRQRKTDQKLLQFNNLSKVKLIFIQNYSLK